MQIRNLQVKNFRGIKEFNWTIDSPVICLIGPGDSTKTTILDAIDFVLSPKWNIPFEDCDFFEGKKENLIEIIVTVGQLPEELIKEGKFGLLTRGWSISNGINDEPAENDEIVLSIKLRVDESLEPNWAVICDRNIEGKPISSKDREKLNCSRLSDYVDKHLSWGQGSALLTITENNKDSAAPILIEALRQARLSANLDGLQEFIIAVDTVKTTAESVGVKFKHGLKPALDQKAMNIGQNAISLHDGEIPVRLLGLGSKRLIALGIQFSCLCTGSCLLIDEFENGLEPHRIRHLLHYLLERIDDKSNPFGQVIMTSHSPVVIQSLTCQNIKIVRSTSGITSVLNVDTDLQGTLRRIPDSLLGNKVLVCEGKTEIGLCMSVENYWNKSNARKSFAYEGVVLVEGEGDNSPRRALHLSEMGYQVCLFMDGDKLDELKKILQDVKNSPIKLIHWNVQYSTERRLINDIPFESIEGLIDLLGRLHNKDDVLSAIISKLSNNQKVVGRTVEEWLHNNLSESEIRNGISRASKDNAWFKRIDYGEELGGFIQSQFELMKETELLKKLTEIEAWIYG
jgi:putative ATP-dependent endonuclease of the OLD family